MQTFKHKTTGKVVEAEILTERNVSELAILCGGLIVEEKDTQIKGKVYPAINVPTPDGRKRLQEGFYLIRQGTNFWVSRRPNFEQNHEAVAVDA